MLSDLYPQEVSRRAEKRKDATWLRHACDAAYGCTPLSPSCSSTCESFEDCPRRLEAVRKARHDLALREKTRRAGGKPQEKQGFDWSAEPTRLCAPKVTTPLATTPEKARTFPDFTCKSVSKETEKALLRERRRALAMTSPGRLERIATQGMTAGRPKPDLWEAPCLPEDGGKRDKKSGKGYRLLSRIRYEKDLVSRQDTIYRETLDFLRETRQARADRRAAAVELAVSLGMPEKAREAYRLLRSWSPQKAAEALTFRPERSVTTLALALYRKARKDGVVRSWLDCVAQAKRMTAEKPIVGRPAPKAPYVRPVKPTRETTPPTTERGKRRAALREARRAGQA